MDRRAFIRYGLSSTFLLGLSAELWAKAQNGQKRESFLVSARGDRQTGCYFSSLRQDEKGNIHLRSAATDFRGHGGSQHPTNKHLAVLYARRHGNMGVVLNLKTGIIENRFYARRHHYFYGHGCFSEDGKWLYTTEFDQQRQQGIIGVRDGYNFQQVGQFSAYGIEPHDLRMMPDGRTLVIANGGLLTKLDDDADTGRAKLNLTTMRSTLSYIDRFTGELLSEYTLSEQQASLRHLDVAPDGTVAVALQVQREGMKHNRLVPLLVIHRPNNNNLEPIDSQPLLMQAMKDYVGNLVIHPTHRTVALTSPRGNMVGLWHMDRGEYQGFHRMNDVCGLTLSADQKHFIASNSYGELRFLDSQTLTEEKHKRICHPQLRWDNHLFTAVI